jgi:hypothetical protein
MKTYKYKTLKGFLSNCSPACGYVRASLLFGGGRVYVAGRGFISFELGAEARAEAADILAGYLYATKGARRAEVAEGLREGLGDLDLFQCFYFNYKKGRGVWCSNSLSGEAFDYCKRKYLR